MSIDVFAWLRAPRWAALASAAALLTVNAASAQDCTKDSDCGAGYMCSSRPAPPCAAPEPDCVPGEKCATPVPADCDQTDYKSCAPAQCANDSDCPDDMLCVGRSSGCTSTSASPPMATCKPGEDCAQPEPTPTPEQECTTDSISECTPRYLVPCKHDADCGDGFKCKEVIAMSCSGSAGVGTSGGGSDPGAGGKGGVPAQDAGTAEPQPPAPPTCTSEPTGEFMCELQVLPCDTADDCPATFECQSNPNRVVCGSAARPPAPTPNDGTGGHATPPADAGVDNGNGAGSAGAGSAPDDSCGDANDGLPVRVCVPHNYYGGSASDSRGTLGEGAAMGTNGNTKGGDGAPVPATAPPDGNGGKSGAGASGGETSSSNTHSASSSDSDKDMGAKASGGGCAVAAPGSETGQGLGLLSVLGMTAMLLRRRARKAA